MKKTLLTLAILMVSFPALAQSTRTSLQSDITTTIDDGGGLTAAELRSILTDITDSDLNLTDDGLGDISDVNTTGVANGDFLFRSGGLFSVFSKAELNLAIGTDIQAYDADLDTYAGITPSANIQSLLGAADYAAMRTQLDLEAGTDFYSISAADSAFQASDAELTTIAGLTETNGNVIYASGSAWTSQDFTALDEDRECVRLSDVGSDATTGTGVANLYFADALTVTGVYAWADTAPTGSVATIDINEAGTTILSTKLTIDAGEKTSGTAATAAVISDIAIAANAEITFDIDGVGSSTAGQGYVACIEFTK